MAWAFPWAGYTIGKAGKRESGKAGKDSGTSGKREGGKAGKRDSRTTRTRMATKSHKCDHETVLVGFVSPSRSAALALRAAASFLVINR